MYEPFEARTLYALIGYTDIMETDMGLAKKACDLLQETIKLREDIRKLGGRYKEFLIAIHEDIPEDKKTAMGRFEHYIDDEMQTVKAIREALDAREKRNSIFPPVDELTQYTIEQRRARKQKVINIEDEVVRYGKGQEEANQP